MEEVNDANNNVDDGAGTSTSTYTLDKDVVQTSVSHYGLWKGGANCQRYSSNNTTDDIFVDSYWKTSRTFSVIGDILSIVIVLCLLLSRMNIRFHNSRLITAMSYLTCFFQGCTFLFLNGNACEANRNVGTIIEEESVMITDGECWFSTGGRINIAAVTFWLATSIVLTDELCCWNSNSENEDGIFERISTRQQRDGSGGRTIPDEENIALKRMD